MSTGKKKTLNIMLVALGVFTLVGACGYAYIGQSFSLKEAVIVVFSLFCFLKGLKGTYQKQGRAKFSDFFKSKAKVFLTILFSVVVLVAVNVIGVKSKTRFDFTREKLHTLSQMTIDQLADIDKKIKMTALFVGEPPLYLTDLLNEYERNSNGQITTEVIDPVDQIAYAAQFGNVINGKERKLIVQSPQSRRDVDFTEATLSQEQINNALARVTRSARYACFVGGHNEYDLFDNGDTGLSTFAKHLLANNIIGKSVFLENDDLASCHVLIFAGPKEHLNRKEENVVKDYLEKGGDALFLIEHMMITTPDKPLTEYEMTKNPSLNIILSDWGIRVNDDVVVDLKSHASGDIGSPATKNYMSHDAIVSDLDYTFYVRPRSISLLQNRRKTIKVAPLVLTQSNDASWGETNRTLDIKYDPNIDRPGPVAIGYVLFEPTTEDKTRYGGSRIIVITDADFLTNVFIGAYSNAKMGLNAVNWLSESDYQVLLDQKEVNVYELDLTSQQKRMVAFLLFLMSLCIVICGLSTWLRRS